jgi:hypothetical protein
MHSESLSACCGFPVAIANPDLGAPAPDPFEGLPPLSAVPPPPFEVVDDEEECTLEVVELLMFATPGLLPPPPQPAISKPTVISAATDAMARGPAPTRWRFVTVAAGRIAAGCFLSTVAGIDDNE